MFFNNPNPIFFNLYLTKSSNKRVKYYRSIVKSVYNLNVSYLNIERLIILFLSRSVKLKETFMHPSNNNKIRVENIRNNKYNLITFNWFFTFILENFIKNKLKKEFISNDKDIYYINSSAVVNSKSFSSIIKILIKISNTLNSKEIIITNFNPIKNILKIILIFLFTICYLVILILYSTIFVLNNFYNISNNYYSILIKNSLSYKDKKNIWIKGFRTTLFSNKNYLFLLKIFLKRIFYFTRKYLYTINHKRIALNYFYFCLWAGLSGGFLALIIRLELSHPGSSFFKGNMLLYLQTITSHGLIMVFFVVVPLIFGFFGNFLLPLHIGSKDVAYPRLNSIGFWVLPAGYLVVVRAGFLKPQLWKRRSYSSKSWFNIKNYQIEKKFENLNELENLNSNTLKGSKELINLEKEDLNYNINKINFNQSNNDNIKSLVNSQQSLMGLKNDEESLKTYKNFLIYTEFFSENFWTNTLKNLWDGKRGKKFGTNNYSWKQYIEKGAGNTKVTTGWTFVTPFTSSVKYSSKGAIDYLLVSVIFAGISTTLTFTNLLVTRRTMTMPGLESRRFLMPFITIGILLVLRYLAVITPVLGSCVLMMYTDRHWSTTFFDFSYGGDPILSQHLFWFFGHPEVYVLVIPTFGIINMILPFSSYRRVASKQHMIWAIYAMGAMGFLVWGHHMYLVGLDHKSRTIYSTITIMISLPATIKIVSWSLSILNSSIKNSYLTFAALSYVLFFLVSGLTGMWLSHVCLNTSLHDTYYVIAHFHLMLSATTLLGLFIGVYYYYYAFFNTPLSTTFVWVHLINYSIGQWFTFLPQFYLGTSGMPRRIHDYPDLFAGWNGFSTAGYFLTLTGVLGFFLVLFDSNFSLNLRLNYQLVPRINNKGTYLSYLFIKLKENKKQYYKI